MRPLPLLNAVVLETLAEIVNPCVAGRRISATTSGVLVGSVDADELVARVCSHPQIDGADAVDVLGAVSGLEALEFITINDPVHVQRRADLLALAGPSTMTVHTGAVVAIHPHPGRRPAP